MERERERLKELSGDRELSGERYRELSGEIEILG